jgi:hypothetical protein
LDSLGLLRQLVLHQQQHPRLLVCHMHLQALPVLQRQLQPLLLMDLLLLLLLGLRPTCRSRVLLAG